MDAISLMIGAAAGAALGGAVAYLLAERRSRAKVGELQLAAALSEQKATGYVAEIEKQKSEHVARLAEVQGLIEEEKRAAELLRGQLLVAEKNYATTSAQLKASQDNISEQKRLLDEANKKLTESFAVVSQDALAKNTAAFLDMAKAKFETLSKEASGDLDKRKEQIATLLKPLEETLGNYQKRLAEIETSRNTAYAALQQQIGQMNATQGTLAQHTQQLVGALTRPNVRGQWGEIALKKLVELAGMTARVDFVEQASVNTEEGRLRPDMIVRLPGERDIIIDCKAVLGAFLDASGATDDETRRGHLRRHAELVRARVKDLAGKAYWSQFKQTPEYVVLFLPGEAFLYAACEHDPELIQDAMGQRVILATPTTLMALLRAIEFGWRQQAVSENAEEIRKLGLEIYDRLAVLASNMAKLGKSLDSAVEHYNTSVGSLETRLLVSARKMGEMGSKNEKELPDTQRIDKRAREFATTLNPEKSPLLPE